jgi:hypothetical protein
MALSLFLNLKPLTAPNHAIPSCANLEYNSIVGSIQQFFMLHFSRNLSD